MQQHAHGQVNTAASQMHHGKDKSRGAAGACVPIVNES